MQKQKQHCCLSFFFTPHTLSHYHLSALQHEYQILNYVRTTELLIFLTAETQKSNHLTSHSIANWIHLDEEGMSTVFGQIKLKISSGRKSRQSYLLQQSQTNYIPGQWSTYCICKAQKNEQYNRDGHFQVTSLSTNGVGSLSLQSEIFILEVEV